MFIKNEVSINFFKDYQNILSDKNLITDFYTSNQMNSFVENNMIKSF